MVTIVMSDTESGSQTVKSQFNWVVFPKIAIRKSILRE